ncbi:MAG: DUF6653 family protein [Pseudomonadota bacterium]
MDYGKLAEKLMGMSDDDWKRHANPWSVWTRVPILPLAVLAIWSRAWIGLWALIPISLCVFWAWLNPRAFSIPKTTNTWSGKGTFGERVWLNRKNIPIPEHHAFMAHLLSGVSLIGIGFLVWGRLYFHVWLTLLGVVLTLGGKIWFVDRMVWLYEDMKDSSEKYKNWLY